MKCSKCGEECKENQAFCLKCGNPIQVVPDFNLIEAELASNIGELLDEMQSGENDGQHNNGAGNDDDIKEVQYNDMELKFFDISRDSHDSETDGKTKVIGNLSKTIREDMYGAEDSAGGDTAGGMDYGHNVQNNRGGKTGNDNGKKSGKKKNGKKKAVIITVLIIVLLAVAVSVFVWVAKSVEKTATSYDEYYKEAKAAYDKMDTAKALDNAKDALDKATNNNEKLEIRGLIYDIHLLSGEKGDDYAGNLEQLIQLGSKNNKYYKALADYYYQNEKYTNLTDLLRGVEDESILEALSGYVVKEPSVDLPAGDYGEYIAVSLTAADGCKIYYTTDSRNPSNYGEEYKAPVQIASEGEFILKAISVNEKGVESKIATFTYNVKLTGSNAPKVTPSGGVYKEYTKIKIEVPEGGKAYYTWDGTIPTAESEEYTGEFDMMRGINVLKVVVIDKYGISSEIAQESYNLQIAAAITVNEAMTLIQQKAEENLEEGETAEAIYEDSVIIENDEYYILTAVVKDAEGGEKSRTIYAVNTYDKEISEAEADGDGYKLKDSGKQESTQGN